MNGILSDDVLYCFDMIRLWSGEILTLCGNFNGPWYRARLSFYSYPESDRLIEGKSYQKVNYETGCLIAGCKKLLDLPGEQHFLVHQSQIAKIYKCSNAFDGLSRVAFKQCQFFIDLLERSCNLSRGRHGLTGSGALHNRLPTSDFDWVIYGRDPTEIEALVISDDRFKRELTFAMAHVYRKYSVFKGLSQEDIDALFGDRWKYFRFLDLNISMSFVNPLLRADTFLHTSRIGEREVLEGMVSNYVGCYHMPCVIPLNCHGRDGKAVLTWLFLYNGAFKNGDVVEVSGRTCTVGDNQYVIVESPQDYIRKVAPERRR